jgi:Ca2+-transporting ATPase
MKFESCIDFKGKLILAGIFALEDPARPEVPPAVRECHGAGVRVIMVTGDHKLTAQAIARDIGILTSDKDRLHENMVVSGDELSDKLAEERANPNNKPDQVEGKVVDWVCDKVER